MDEFSSVAMALAMIAAFLLVAGGSEAGADAVRPAAAAS